MNLNTQIGEDLVTNPEAQSIPEEILLSARNGGGYSVVSYSNQVDAGEQLISPGHLRELRSILSTIHSRFAELYQVSADEPFAMEVEFKITADGVLAIKQARPWVY